jgi:hypothetical protein
MKPGVWEMSLADKRRGLDFFTRGFYMTFGVIIVAMWTPQAFQAVSSIFGL